MVFTHPSIPHTHPPQTHTHTLQFGADSLLVVIFCNCYVGGGVGGVSGAEQSRQCVLFMWQQAACRSDGSRIELSLFCSLEDTQGHKTSYDTQEQPFTCDAGRETDRGRGREREKRREGRQRERRGKKKVLSFEQTHVTSLSATLKLLSSSPTYCTSVEYRRKKVLMQRYVC